MTFRFGLAALWDGVIITGVTAFPRRTIETMSQNNFLTDQLIPYLGNKRKLTGLVRRAVERTGLDAGTFFDAFAGSGAVGRLAKTLGFQIISNDWEPYARAIAQTYIGCNRAPRFEKLGGLDRAIARLNALPGRLGYIASHYCPADDDAPDPDRERMFYTQANGRRIDAIREQLEDWRADGLLSEREFSVLLAPLLFQAAYVSNTSGVFKGWHRGWGGATKTAWYRILSSLTLARPVFHDNSKRNSVLCDDACRVAPEVPCDIAYLDPPYNQHQYGANYHLLNTIALWDKPTVSRHYGQDGRRDKSAIRTDWRTLRRSRYCYRSSALPAFAELLQRLQARWMLVSYSTDGIMTLDELTDELGRHGKLDVVMRRYKRYRVSSQRPSPRRHTTEFVLIVQTGRPSTRRCVSRVLERIRGNDGG